MASTSSSSVSGFGCSFGLTSGADPVLTATSSGGFSSSGGTVFGTTVAGTDGGQAGRQAPHKEILSTIILAL
ncbi:MAG TPA: hypothetical protein VH500_19585 [Nitrososphaeraceae archaeon]